MYLRVSGRQDIALHIYEECMAEDLSIFWAIVMRLKEQNISAPTASLSRILTPGEKESR